jgi:hypothetical protein
MKKPITKTKKPPNSNKNLDTNILSKDKLEMINEYFELLKVECDNYPYGAFIVNKESLIEYCNDRGDDIFK